MSCKIMREDKNVPVVLGNCIRVYNLEHLGGEPDHFICLQVEDGDGTEEYAILLTEEELKDIPEMVWEDAGGMVAGRVYARFMDGRNWYLVKIKDKDRGTIVGKFDIGLWSRCFQRALSHPTSCTRKRLLTDLLD